VTFRSYEPISPGSKLEPAIWTAHPRLHDFLFSGFDALFSNIAGIFGAHNRASIMEPYQEQVISSENPLTREVAWAYAQYQSPHFDSSWEQVRRYFCPMPSPGFT